MVNNLLFNQMAHETPPPPGLEKNMLGEIQQRFNYCSTTLIQNDSNTYIKKSRESAPPNMDNALVDVQKHVTIENILKNGNPSMNSKLDENPFHFDSKKDLNHRRVNLYQNALVEVHRRRTDLYQKQIEQQRILLLKVQVRVIYYFLKVVFSLQQIRKGRRSFWS